MFAKLKTAFYAVLMLVLFAALAAAQVATRYSAKKSQTPTIAKKTPSPVILEESPVPLPVITEGVEHRRVIAPPVILPAKQPAAPPLPTGVEADKISVTARWSVAGEDSGPEAVYELVGAPGLADDSKKPIVTVIDDDAGRRAELLGQLKAKLGDRVKFWDGPAADWSFRPGFAAKTGAPTLYVQSPDGTVVHRQEGLEGAVDAAAEAVRKPFPDYQPTKDPDLRLPKILPFLPFNFTAGGKAALGLGVLGGVALLLTPKRKKVGP